MDNILYQLLEKWFLNTNLKGRNVWSQNQIAKLIKAHLELSGHFRLRRHKKNRTANITQAAPKSKLPAPAPNKGDW